jgi:asparagine synthase (glutamine-hydrolysing)
MIISHLPPSHAGLRCYTFNGPFRDCADAVIAREIAQTCGLLHSDLRFGRGFFDEFDGLARKAIAISGGAMDVTGAAEIFMNRLAAGIAPARLTGNYGSEILRHHVAFRSPRGISRLFSCGVRSMYEEACSTYAQERMCSDISFIVTKQVPWHHFARSSVERSQVNVRSPYLDKALVELAYKAPIAKSTLSAACWDLINAGNPALGKIPNNRGVRHGGLQIANRWRSVVSDFRTRAEYAWDYGMPKWLCLLDRAVSPLCLERLFLGFQKFCHFRLWYREHLSAYVQDTLLSCRALSRWYLEPKAVKSAVEAHIRGTANYTAEIHKLLSLELIHQIFIDS